MSAMAMLDRDGVYGAARFHLAAVKAHSFHQGAYRRGSDGHEWLALRFAGEIARQATKIFAG